MRNAYGLAAAILAASMVSSMGGDPIYAETRRQKQERKPRLPSPNDCGPVIDTTRESKRARRRRLAKVAIIANGGEPDLKKS